MDGNEWQRYKTSNKVATRRAVIIGDGDVGIQQQLTRFAKSNKIYQTAIRCVP